MKLILLTCLLIVGVLTAGTQANCPITQDPESVLHCLADLTTAAVAATTGNMKTICRISDNIARCVQDELGECVAAEVASGVLDEISAIAKNCCPDRNNPKCTIQDSRIEKQRCFAADSLVTLADGTHKSIAHLHAGDSLLAYDDHTKQLISTPLLTMLDFQPHHFALFKQVTTISGRSLSLTSSHLLPTDTNDYIMAKNIRSGMNIYIINDDGVLISERVANVTDVVKQGYMAPLTSEGTLIVNNVAASCYAVIDSHSAAHAILAPMRWWYGIAGTSKESSGLIGVHWFAKMLYEMATFVAPSIIHT